MTEDTTPLEIVKPKLDAQQRIIEEKLSLLYRWLFPYVPSNKHTMFNYEFAENVRYIVGRIRQELMFSMPYSGMEDTITTEYIKTSPLITPINDFEELSNQCTEVCNAIREALRSQGKILISALNAMKLDVDHPSEIKNITGMLYWLNGGNHLDTIDGFQHTELPEILKTIRRDNF